MLCWWIGTDANVANERSTTWKWTLAANVHTRLSLTSSTKWIWLKDKLSYLSECLLSCKPDRPIVSFSCKRVKEYNDVFIVEKFVKSCVGAVNWTRTTKMRLSLLSPPPPKKKKNTTKNKKTRQILISLFHAVRQNTYYWHQRKSIRAHWSTTIFHVSFVLC